MDFARVARRKIALAVALLACGGARPAAPRASSIASPASSEPQIVATLPMRLLRKVPFVRVQVDAGAPEWFVVDTGSPVSVFAARLASRMTKRAAEALIVGDGTDAGTAMPTYAFDGIRFGAVTLNGVTGIAADLTALTDHIGLPIGGILGFDAFADYLLTLDYPGRRVVLERGALPDVDQRDVLYLTDHDAHPAIALRIAGKGLLAEVDSGSGFWMQVPPSMIGELPFVSAPVVMGRSQNFASTSVVRAGRLRAEMTIGRHVVVDPVASTEEGGALDADGVVRLGGPLLARFAVTFDARSGRARFACRACDPIAVPPVKSLGFGFVRDAAGWQIAPFVPGAKKPAVDLAVGDRVVSLDGRDGPSLDADALDPASYAPGTELHFVFERAGRTFAAAVPVLVLVR